MHDQELKVGKYTVTITHPDRILFPKSKISKEDLVDYYYRIAPIMLEHIKDRPISMQRYPGGITQEGFFQKDAPDYFPSWIKLLGVEKEDKTKVVSHVLCNNAATLVYLANQAVITPHIWLSKADKINYPDLMIFDLDPSVSKSFDKVCKGAKIVKVFLESLGLHPFVMTTGSRGLHVTTPIKRELMFDKVRECARSIAELLVQEHPELFTLEMRKAKRGNKIFVDYLRNAWAQTAVAPYAVRAREKAPIATPLLWKEVNASLDPQKYNIGNIFRRVARVGDPWSDIDAHAGSLARVIRKL